MLRAGDEVAQYTIVDVLGEGGMGAVYRARDERLERVVALKVLVEAEDPDFAKRLRREALAAASLSHPNVVSVYDVGSHEGRVYLAMEVVEGRTLRELVGHPDVPWTERLRWMVDVARALEAAHATGLVHRDIKPENVVLRKDGVIKVLDFGIARNVAVPEASEAVITGRGQIIGTPAYMAPEQLRGGETEPATDQFAWGVMAYEVLTGERPWKKSADIVTVIANILSDAPAPLRSKLPDVPPVVEGVIHRAMEKLPEGRNPSLGHVVAKLEPFTSHTTIQADRVTLKPLTETKEDEAFLATTRVPTVRSTPPEDAETAPRPSTRPRRSRRTTWLAVATLIMVVGVVAVLRRKPTPIVLRVSDNPLAEQAYREGTQLFRDGALDRAERALARATELDPECAAAHLELALLAFEVDAARGVEHYQAAFQYRAKLSLRDTELLDASEPYLRSTSDLEEWQTRLLRATKRFPRDAEIFYWLGLSREKMFDYEAAKDAYGKSLGVDNAFITGYAARARAAALLGDGKAALDDYDRCLRGSPVATVCVKARFALLMQSGACARGKDDAERWTSMDAKEPDAHSALAAALVATEAPTASVEEVLKREWALLDPKYETAHELQDRVLLAIREGDFVRAESLALAWEKALPATAPRDERARAARILTQIHEETGDLRRAGVAAKNFLERRASFPADAWSTDPSAWFFKPMARAGFYDKAKLDEARRTWLREEEERDGRKERERQSGFRWAILYGDFAESPAEARDAIALLPGFQPMPPETRRTPEFDYAMGKTLALAGRGAEAEAYLSHAVLSCTVFESPFAAMHARYELARVLEVGHQLERARALYQSVLDRWQTARPRSLTATHAEERLKALK